jgi:ribosomal protein S18 acetylase RimI-like enzyme
VTWLTHGLLKHGLFELDRICLLKESRGIGLGKTLVDKLVENARIFYKERSEKIRKLYLLTHEENKSAQLFYEKIGFSHEATLKDHYYRGKQEKVYSMFFN